MPPPFRTLTVRNQQLILLALALLDYQRFSALLRNLLFITESLESDVAK
jgi:hypothetical protein